MKNLIIIFGIILASCQLLNAQSMVNSGAKIVNESPSSIVFGGNYINEETGDILNEGTVVFKADLINNATPGNFMQGSMGLSKFNGPSTQSIGGLSTSYFYDLVIGSTVQVNTITFVKNTLQLSTYNILLNNVGFLMEDGSNIIGANPLAYIKTLGSAQLMQTVYDLDMEFPVGTSSSYCPLILRNDNVGGQDLLAVNVFPDVMEEGTTGATISDIDHCVNLTWDIVEWTPGDMDMSITAHWNASDEGSNFDRTRAGIGHYVPGMGWDKQMSASATGTNPYSLTRSGITSLSAFAVGDSCSPMANTLILRMDITAFLEGPFNGTDMNRDLNSENHIPLSHPFNVPPWNYAGLESVASIPNSDVVDWILLELRDAEDASKAYSSTIMDRKAAFLLKDGNIVDLDGNSNVPFANALNEKLHIVLHHRNHLSILSANPVYSHCGIYAYNFSVAVDMAFGGSDGHKELLTGSNTWGMIGGDGDANEIINLDDKTNVWNPQTGQVGYLGGDFNLDGQVNNSDKNDVWNKNLGYTSQVNDPPFEPSNPVPIDGAVDQPLSVILSWTCSDPENDPLTYNIYFSETNPPSLVASGNTTTTYDPGLLYNSTTYYWRVVVTDNHNNSTEGQVWSFATILGGSPCPGMPTVTDIDGNTYNTTQIGIQCWMKENLKTTTYNNGTSIPNVTGNSWNNLTTGAYVWYDNDISWKNFYGALYNWFTTVDPNGLCPTGWHMPTDDEWTVLTDYIGGTGSPYGNELKSCRQVNSPLGGDCNTTEHPRWDEETQWGHYGTDVYGFSGLPGGYRTTNGFYFLGNSGYWWTSTEYSSEGAWGRNLGYFMGNVFVYDAGKEDGFSVRCLRD